MKKLARARRHGHADPTDEDDDDDGDEGASPKTTTLTVPRLAPVTSASPSSLNISPISPCQTRSKPSNDNSSSSGGGVGGGSNSYLRSKQRGTASAKQTSTVVSGVSAPPQQPAPPPARRRTTAAKKHSRFRTTGIVAISAVTIVQPTKKQKARAHSHSDATAVGGAKSAPGGKAKKGASTACFSLLLPIMATMRHHSKDRDAEAAADAGSGAKVKKFVRHAKGQMKLLKATKKAAGIGSTTTTAKRTMANKT